MNDELHSTADGATTAARRSRRARTAAGAALVVAAAALLAGCGTDSAVTPPRQVSGSAGPAGDSPAAASTAPTGGTATVSPRATRSPEAAGSPSATSAVSPSRSAPSGRCHTSDLAAAVGADNPGAGQENFSITLTNTSDRTCTLYGFPGLAFLDSAGGQVSVDPRRTPAQAAVVSLKPGAAASSGLTFGNLQLTGAAGVTPASVEITPPDEKAPLTVAWQGGPVAKNASGGSVPMITPLSAGAGS